MTQPKFAPIMEQHEVREVQRLGAPAAWTTHRPGESRPTPRPARQPGLGVPGPDQGYALALAGRFEDRLVLEPGERVEDVLAGAVAIALRRAAIFGRAPIAADIELALGLFKYIIGDEGTWPSGDLVALRRERFEKAAHDYWRRRALVDAIPEASFRLNPERLAKRLESEPGCWRELVGA
ncbi:MAG: hypothetical protein ABSA65_17205 [Acidimicrobiales bacterium]|jgi:hypothetical protein